MGNYKTLHKEKWSNIEDACLELFSPVDDEFIRYLASNKPADTVSLTISPESGCDNVRSAHGRKYDNEAILRTLDRCEANSVPIDFHFMIGLAHESFESLDKMWALWDKILSRKTAHFLASVDFGPMVLLDLGSIAYDNPAACGYRMLYTTLSEMQHRLSDPCWVDWINYETLHMTRDDLVESIFKATETLTQLKEKYGMTDPTKAYNEMIRLRLERAIIREVRDIMRIPDEKVRLQRLKELDQIYRDPLLSYSYVITSEEEPAA
jgi:hypothetical protein